METREVVGNLRCNCCFNCLEGMGFRTICLHLICNECASKSFSRDCLCPICSKILSDGDVHSLSIGLSSGDIGNQVFQFAFQNESWHEIVRRGNECVHNVVDLINFTQSQILFQADKFSYSNHVLQDTIEQNKILLVLNLYIY